MIAERAPATNSADGANAQLMPRFFIRDALSAVSTLITLNGWLGPELRPKEGRSFYFYDRTGTAQAYCTDTRQWTLIDGIPLNSAIRVTGRVVGKTSDAQPMPRISVEDISLLAAAANSRDTPEGNTARSMVSGSRCPDRFLLFEIRTRLEAAFRERLLADRFVEVHTPRISKAGNEIGTEVFGLQYFGQRAYLTPSQQFYIQLAIACGLDRVFDIGPVFRAEARSTNRHAVEFVSLDIAISWIETLEQLMAFEEGLLVYGLKAIRDAFGNVIEDHFGAPLHLPTSPIPRLPLSTVAELIPDSAIGRTGKLSHHDEEAISKYVWEQYGHEFVFVTHFPAASKPFYAMRDERPSTDGIVRTESFDLLFRGVEITSGGRLEYRPEKLREQIDASGIDPAVCSEYLEPYYVGMFGAGCPPHGGFGIGLDRLVMMLLAQRSLREACFVFRGPNRLTP